MNLWPFGRKTPEPEPDTRPVRARLNLALGTSLTFVPPDDHRLYDKRPVVGGPFWPDFCRVLGEGEARRWAAEAEAAWWEEWPLP